MTAFFVFMLKFSDYCFLNRGITLPTLVFILGFLYPFSFHQGAARRVTTQRKNVEIESTGGAGKSDFERVKKYFRLEVNNFLAPKHI